MAEEKKRSKFQVAADAYEKALLNFIRAAYGKRGPEKIKE